MSYIFNKKIEYSDSPNLDAFGRLRVSYVSNLIDIKHTYDKNPLYVDEVLNGSATSVLDIPNARDIMSVTTSGDFAIRQSKIRVIYQPGKSQLFEASFSNFQIESNVIKRVGGYTTTTGSPYNTILDGFVLESNGVTNEIGFYVYKSGTTIFSALTSSWTSTEFDPNNIDFSKTNLMLVDYQWLGVGRIRMGLILSGVTYYFTQYAPSNNFTTVYMSSPNQPIRYEIRSSGGTGSLDMICSAFSVEGIFNELTNNVGLTHSATTTLTTSGTKYPYIGYRLKQGYLNVNPSLNNVDILNTSNDNYVITAEYNPTLSSTPIWVDLPNTPFEYSLQNGTNTITSAGFILNSFIGAAGTSALSQVQFQQNQVKIGSNINGTRDEIWICLTPLGANATFVGNVNLKYFL